MVELDQRAIDEAVHEGESMRPRELVDLFERYHDDRPGIPEATLEAYARELADRDEVSFDADGFLDTVSERLTDSDGWVADGERLYALDEGRISQYPATWHDRLGGERDPATYIRFFEEMAPSFLTEDRGDRRGIKADRLLDVVSVVGGMSRKSAKAAIESARDDGRVVEDADQHPKAGVYLAE
ncbi:hypothetical protein NDI56_10745 [Haloarcula sp. S1CR25-12]|uniref:Uncharacterized protein n=1 Tax=Haloarcula saliterrae TaxID=2950534 RepID=A0ABU2FDF6_9EURY|nr:hypothetical protein [Haloarcula sp. S1CR25-12]MDS0259870.1 hypothetical protein [Haloarcula sp. S1CR25-12]